MNPLSASRSAWVCGALSLLLGCGSPAAPANNAPFDGTAASDGAARQDGATSDGASPNPLDEPTGDPDGDGLTNAEEKQLGTLPWMPDSDFDGRDDADEVGDTASPTDSDGDGVIDALESEIADNDGDGKVDQVDDSGGWRLNGARFIPFAVRADGKESARVEVALGSTVDVTGVSLSLSKGVAGSPNEKKKLDGLRVDGADVGAEGIALFDDGTHGDVVGGDGVWTRDQITSLGKTYYGGGKLGIHELDTITLTTEAGKDVRHVWDGYKQGKPVFRSGAIRLGIVKSDAVVTPVTVDTSKGLGSATGHVVQRTPHLVNLVDPKHVGEPFGQLRQAKNHRLKAVTEKVIAAMGDHFDFLYFFLPRAAHAPAAGITAMVRGEVKGIGKPFFDNGTKWGSAKQLKSVIVLDFKTNGPILHETLHLWSAALKYPAVKSGHWGYSSANGQHGGFDPATLEPDGPGQWKVKSFGTFANGGDSKLYGPIELYVAGWLAAKDLPDFLWFESPKKVGTSGKLTIISATALHTVTAADIIEKHGARDPGFADAQKTFRGLFSVVSEQALTATEMSFYEVQAQIFGAPKGAGTIKSFAQATGGVATMDTAVLAP